MATSKTNQQVKEAAELLEKGVQDIFDSGRFAEYLEVMSRFHNYSARNCILIMMQCPNATYVASYRKWQSEFNRQVRKGEKSIRIFAPIQHKRTMVAEDPTTGEQTEHEVSWTGFKAVPVFDISQTDGEELPSLASKLTGDVDGFEQTVKAIEAVASVPVRYDELEDGSNGYYSSVTNEIVVKAGMSQEQTVKTLIHEVAHSILHCDGGEQDDAKRNIREVQAEGVAFVVCNAIGIDSSDYSFGYLAGWGGVKETVANLEVIRKTANEILEKIA